MTRSGAPYYYVVLAESLALAAMCTVSIVWLGMDMVETNYDFLKQLVRAALVISVLLIPMESVLFSIYRKKNPQCGLAGQRPLIQLIFSKLALVFAAFYLIHYLVFLLIQQKHQLKQGSDLYMFYLRPGSSITLLSLFGTTVADGMAVRGKKR